MPPYSSVERPSSRDRGSANGTGGVPEIAIGFWTNRLVVTAGGGILGEALNRSYLHHSGRVIVALMLWFGGALVWRAAAPQLARATFWSALFAASVLGLVLARTIDAALGVGDPAATLQIVPLLVLSFVLCYRNTGTSAALTDHPVDELFFWPIAAITQVLGSALAGWSRYPGGPGYGLALMVIAVGLLTTIGLASLTRLPRAALFWIAFLLTGVAAALGGVRGYEIVFGY
ncbi:putative membrane-anchored protein [Bradyrhizobium sp. LA6.4]